jgi:hypothetical protein
MPDQHGFGDNGTESTRPRQSGQSDDQMNEYDSEIAHPGNGINTSQTTALRPIWQFAMERNRHPRNNKGKKPMRCFRENNPPFPIANSMDMIAQIVSDAHLKRKRIRPPNPYLPGPTRHVAQGARS